MSMSKPVRIILRCLLVLVAAASFLAVFIPVFLIQPFRLQTAGGLGLSYFLRSWSPVVTVAGAFAVLVLLLLCWRISRWRFRIVSVLLLGLTLFSVWGSRQNHFEWMFEPLPDPSYARASEATFLDDRDMVLSFTISGDAVAYPVRYLAYHHIVQDTVGGQPVVATY